VILGILIYVSESTVFLGASYPSFLFVVNDCLGNFELILTILF